MERKTWVYWEGPRSALLDLCIESIERHFPNVCVLGPEEFDRLWITDRFDWSHIPSNARGDWVRWYLLYHFGGVWVDADTLVLRDCHEVVDLLDEYDQIGYKTTRNRWRMCGLIGCNTGDLAVKRWCERAQEIIMASDESSWKTRIGRGLIGPRMLVKLPPEEYGLNVKLWPQHYWLQDRSGWGGKPVNPHLMNRSGPDPKWQEMFFPDAYAYHVGFLTMRRFAGSARRQLLTMDRALGYLVRRSRHADYYERTYEHLYQQMAYQRGYLRRSSLDREVFPWMKENIWDQFQSVLDIGTSYGWVVHTMAQHGKEATGVDISRMAVNKAVQMGRNVVHGSALELPFPDKSFDAVTSSDVFEHFLPEDAQKAIKEAVRVCRRWLCMRVSDRPSANVRANRIFGNIHPTVKPIDWWIEQFQKAARGSRVVWRSVRTRQDTGIDFVMELPQAQG